MTVNDEEIRLSHFAFLLVSLLAPHDQPSAELHKPSLTHNFYRHHHPFVFVFTRWKGMIGATAALTVTSSLVIGAADGMMFQENHSLRKGLYKG